jgi:hypothetical protein
MATLFTVTLDELEFVTVTTCAEVVAPVDVFAKLRFEGETVRVGAVKVTGIAAEAALA